MRFHALLIVATLSAASMAIPLAAAQETSTLSSADLLDVTCADYIEALGVADPGKHPSKARAAEAQEAQDDIANGLMWIHGYMSGRNPGTAPTLNEQWMADTVVRLAKVCKDSSGDGKLRLTDAAAKL